MLTYTAANALSQGKTKMHHKIAHTKKQVHFINLQVDVEK